MQLALSEAVDAADGGDSADAGGESVSIQFRVWGRKNLQVAS